MDRLAPGTPKPPQQINFPLPVISDNGPPPLVVPAHQEVTHRTEGRFLTMNRLYIVGGSFYSVTLNYQHKQKKQRHNAPALSFGSVPRNTSFRCCERGYMIILFSALHPALWRITPTMRIILFLFAVDVQV